MVLRLGDRVRVDIPDESDPYHEYHGEHGIVINIVDTVYACGYGETYRVVFEERDLGIDMHPWDVRLPITPLPSI